MRIRRKKHLRDRLDNVNQYIIPIDRSEVNVKEAIKNKQYIQFSQVFNNDLPVKLEIGCGKGGFICETATIRKEFNYVAVELLENIIVMASEKANQLSLNNVRFVNCGAEYLPKYIPDNSIDEIFLNFSPPFPGKSYMKRRLTYNRNVQNYKNFLKDNCSVIQKTDDKDFFDYSFEQFVKFGFEVRDISNELNNGEFFSVQTEYEKKFRALNQPIYALVATKTKTTN